MYLKNLFQRPQRCIHRLIKIIVHVNPILNMAFPRLWLFEQAPRNHQTGVGDGQGSLASCSAWGREEWNTTEQLNYQLSTQTKPLAMTYMVLTYLPHQRTRERNRGRCFHPPKCSHSEEYKAKELIIKWGTLSSVCLQNIFSAMNGQA